MYKTLKVKLLFCLVVVMVLLSSSLDIIKSILIGKFFDDTQLIKNIGDGLILIVVFLVVYLFVGILRAVIHEILINKVRFQWAQNLYQHYLKQKVSKLSQSEWIHIFTNKVDVVIEQYLKSQILMVSYIVSFVFESVYIGMIHWGILLFLYACTLCILLLNKMFYSYIAKSKKRLIQNQQEWIHSIQDCSYNFSVLKNYKREDWMIDRLNLKNKGLCQSQFYADGILNGLEILNDGIGQWMFFGTILFGVLLIHMHQMRVGQLISIIQASNMVVMPIVSILSLKNRLESAKVVKEELEKELNTNTYAHNQVEIKDSIELKKISFSYGDHRVLKDISYRFKKNKKYLILGKSGCGKSTLLNVMMHRMSIDASYIQQNELLFHDTLKNNITLGKSCDDQFIENILRTVGLSDFVSRLNEKMDNLAETISGGQKQKIALARALWYKKSWLILDESFSSLDVESEIQIEKYLLNQKDVGLILVSHSVLKETVPLFDFVLLLKDGVLTDITNWDYETIQEYA